MQNHSVDFKRQPIFKRKAKIFTSRLVWNAVNYST